MSSMLRGDMEFRGDVELIAGAGAGAGAGACSALQHPATRLLHPAAAGGRERESKAEDRERSTEQGTEREHRAEHGEGGAGCTSGWVSSFSSSSNRLCPPPPISSSRLIPSGTCAGRVG